MSAQPTEPTVKLNRPAPPNLEIFESLGRFAAEECVCDEKGRLVGREVPGALCAPCGARRILNEFAEWWFKL